MANITSEQAKEEDTLSGRKANDEKASQDGPDNSKDKNSNSSDDFVIDPDYIALDQKQKKEAHDKFIAKDSDLDGYIDVQQLKALLDGKWLIRSNDASQAGRG